MYILVDKKRMVVVYRCEKVETVRALANIEFAHASTFILEEASLSAYNCLSTFDLQSLFKGLTGGTDPHSHNAEHLIGQVARLCQTAPASNVDGFEVTVQSLQLKPQDTDFYRYAKGQSRAQHLEAPYNPPPLLGDWKAAQGLPLPTGQTAPPTPAKPVQHAQPWAVAPSTTPPKYAPPWL
jgi:hypothetical protein